MGYEHRDFSFIYVSSFLLAEWRRRQRLSLRTSLENHTLANLSGVLTARGVLAREPLNESGLLLE